MSATPERHSTPAHDRRSVSEPGLGARLRDAWRALRGSQPTTTIPPTTTPHGPVRELAAYEATYDPRYGDWLRPPEPGQDPRDHASVEREVGHFWYALVMMTRPQRVLETGTHVGYGTCCIAGALRDLSRIDGQERRIVTMDPVMPPSPGHLWKGHELERFVRFVQGKSHDVAAEALAQLGGSPDMLVLDSDHGYRTVIWELQAFEPALGVGGLVVFHDALYYDGVGLAIRQLIESGRFEAVSLDTPRHTLDHPRPSAGRRSEFRCPGVVVARKRAKGPVVELIEALGPTPTGDLATPAVLRRGEAEQ